MFLSFLSCSGYITGTSLRYIATRYEYSYCTELLYMIRFRSPQ